MTRRGIHQICFNGVYMTYVTYSLFMVHPCQGNRIGVALCFHIFSAFQLLSYRGTTVHVNKDQFVSLFCQELRRNSRHL